jgi:hypothetical protein
MVVVGMVDIRPASATWSGAKSGGIAVNHPAGPFSGVITIGLRSRGRFRVLVGRLAFEMGRKVVRQAGSLSASAIVVNAIADEIGKELPIRLRSQLTGSTTLDSISNTRPFAIADPGFWLSPA